MISRIRIIIKLWFQRRIRGWDDREIWSLDVSLAQLTLSRLKRFKKLSLGYPSGLTLDSWHTLIEDMIFAMEEITSDRYFEEDKLSPRAKHGIIAFRKYYRNLWW